MVELAMKGQMQRKRRGFNLRDELLSLSIGYQGCAKVKRAHVVQGSVKEKDKTKIFERE